MVTDRNILLSPEVSACPSFLIHLKVGFVSSLPILDADSDNNSDGEEDNPRLELRQDGESVKGGLGFADEAGNIYSGSLHNALYLVSDYMSDHSFLQLGTNNTVRLTIDNIGNVGIGTIAPQGMTHLKSNGDVLLILEADSDNVGESDNPRIEFRQDGTTGVKGGIGFVDIEDKIYTGALTNAMYLVSDYISDHSSLQLGTNNTAWFTIDNVGNIGIGTTSPSYPLEMASGAHVTTAGVWTNASSREYKENIRDLTFDEAKHALSELSPSKFNYKADKNDDYLGFIAEDVPELVATKDRKGLSPMDIVAVLTKVVQKQQEENVALSTKFQQQQVIIDRHQKENAILNAKLAAIMSRLEAFVK